MILYYQKAMPINRRLFLVRTTSFLSLFCIILNFFLMMVLNNYIPAAPGGIIRTLGFISFAGLALGSLLCPFFLPRPVPAAEPCRPTVRLGRGSPPAPAGVAFIVLIVLPNLIFRSMGVELWIGSVPIRVVTTVLTGMLYPLCAGLFFFSHLYPTDTGQNRTGRYGVSLFALALAGSLVGRHTLVYLINFLGLSSDPAKTMILTFDINKWLIMGTGICSVINVILLKGTVEHTDGISGGNPAAMKALPQGMTKTDWPAIFLLFGLAVVFRILGSLLDMRLFALMSRSVDQFRLYQLILAAVVAICGIWAGFSINRFLQRFLPIAIVFFILLPCMLLFGINPRFMLLVDTLVGVFNYLLWVVFSSALIEFYAGGFLFYSLAGAIHFTYIFSFAGLAAARFIPEGTEYTVLWTGIAAVLFLVLAFRFLFRKTTPETESPAAVPLSLPVTPAADLQLEPGEGTASVASLEEIFLKHGLSKRETEVALLMVREGLENKEIGKRLYIAQITAKNHVSSIYRKFAVKNRVEFMTLFVSRRWQQ